MINFWLKNKYHKSTKKNIDIIDAEIVEEKENKDEL